MEVTTLPEVPELRRRARTAGWLYLLVAVTAPWTVMILPRLLIVSRDPEATAARIRELECATRGVIAADVAQSLLWVAVVLAVYRLLRHVDRSRALTLLALGALLPTPIGLAADALRIAAYTLAQGAPFLAAIPTPQQEALAYLALNVHGKLANIVSVFWGLWLFPFASLVCRPGLAPRWIGVALVITGAGYLVHAYLTMLAPDFARTIGPVFLVTAFGELPVIGWLLWWGTRPANPQAQRA